MKALVVVFVLAAVVVVAVTFTVLAIIGVDHSTHTGYSPAH